MAKVNKSLLKQWQDGQVMHGPDYNRERDLLVDAYNDTQTQVDTLKSTPSVSTGMLQDGSVTEPKIRAGAVTNSKLGAKSVTNDKLGDLSVGTGNITNGAITDSKLADNSVTNGKIADGAVTTSKIADEAVTAAKLARESVTSSKLAIGAVYRDAILSRAVTTEKIEDAAVSTTKIADRSVTSAKLADNSVTPTKIVKDSVTQFTYDFATIDERIAAAISGGIPQAVIDEIRQDVDSSVTDLQGRLDNNVETNVALNAGTQIITASRKSKFNLSRIQGKVLINLLGRLGSFEIGSVMTFFGSGTSTIVSENGGKRLNVALASGTSCTGGTVTYIPVVTGKYYVAIGMVKASSAVNSSVALGVQGATGNSVVEYRDYEPSVLRYTRADLLGDSIRVGLFVQGTAGSSGRMHSLRVYEVSYAEYQAMATMTPKAIADKYPYVNGISPVRNPYVIRYGENIVPSLYAWNIFKSAADEVILLSPNEMEINDHDDGNGTTLATTVSCAASTTYRFHCEDTEGTYLETSAVFYDADGATVGGTGTMPDTRDFTFTTPANAASVEISVRILATTTFMNPMLTIGSALKPFKPREDSILALQTDLYALPIMGFMADELFENNGQYFKVSKWRSFTLDGGNEHTYAIDSFTTGSRRVAVNGAGVDYSTISQLGSRYDGLPLKYTTNPTTDNEFLIQNNRYLYVVLPLADTGWGNRMGLSYSVSATNGTTSYPITNVPAGTQVIPNTVGVKINGVAYNNFSVSGNVVTLEVAATAGSTITITYNAAYIPTADEIKAYFMGWRMYDAASDASSAYNGSGGKAWVNLAKFVKGDHSEYTTTLPTVPAAEYTPYQFVIQRKEPVVEPVVSEGMLTFNESDNQIEVGTGMVVRESAKPVVDPTDGSFWINGRTAPSYPLSKKPSKILSVYKNNLPDKEWMFRPVDAGYENIYGLVQARLGVGLFDPSAAYSVTYLMLDMSQPASITGSYAANEKTMLQELTDAVQQNATAVSALMQRKVEKDAPAALIAPTLINGWKQYSSYQTVGYRKDSAGVVHLTGLTQSGPISSHIFRLPVGFRPKRPLIFPVCANAGTNRVDVQDDGYIFFNWAGTWDSTAWVSLDGISFVAEQ